LLAPGANAARITQTFTNNTASTFPATGNANPYGLPITVAGLTGKVSDLNIGITGLSHTNALDLAFALTPPVGQAIDIYDGAGGAHALTNVNLSLDDEAATFLPQSAAISTGSYKPAVWFLGTSFPAPGPGTSFCLTGFSTSANCTLTKVDAIDPNGTWTLYAIDVPNGTAGANTSTGSFAGYSITIEMNRDPSASGAALSVLEDGLLTGNVVALASDPDSDSLSASTVTAPAHAAAFSLGSAGSFSYTPAANYNGPDSFTYRVSDGKASATATVDITVTPVNDAPTVPNSTGTTKENTPLVVGAPGVLTGATDVEGDPITAVLNSGPAHGSLTLKPDGSYTYTPVAGYDGPDSFTFKATDGSADSAVATVNLTVTYVKPPSRAAYCSVAGNTNPFTGAPIRPGTFLDLVVQQPDTDSSYKGALPANFLQGVGLTCDVLPGFVATGQKVGSSPAEPGMYPYYRKA